MRAGRLILVLASGALHAPLAAQEVRAGCPAGCFRLARQHGISLEDFGGTGDGVIGALAAVGLLAGGDDGRVVHLPSWSWPDEFAGCQSVAALRRRGVDEIRNYATGEAISSGVVDIGKHLRPAYRDRRVVLFVDRRRGHPNEEELAPTWQALKLL